ncbi:hypothetical protein MRB53_014199 [Persea americana]|uniref:Uncharacterized protein n=1 Tax=Persea americana TaxID=3435 RepID=A0ACC2KAT0_PERAE|nr:hypothetical protein MRB53_014199 [Persea americana]
MSPSFSTNEKRWIPEKPGHYFSSPIWTKIEPSFDPIFSENPILYICNSASCGPLRSKVDLHLSVTSLYSVMAHHRSEPRSAPLSTILFLQLGIFDSCRPLGINLDIFSGSMRHRHAWTATRTRPINL